MQNPTQPTEPKWQVTKITRGHARTLRRNSTDAEMVIWNAVRAHRLNGASFRRQAPIGPFIADFVCHAALLIIEIDGSQHYDAVNLKRDARRAAFLAAKGFRVLRFNNLDVLRNRNGVLETILAAIEASPP